jgi:hypothetical protein
MSMVNYIHLNCNYFRTFIFVHIIICTCIIRTDERVGHKGLKISEKTRRLNFIFKIKKNTLTLGSS